MLNRHTFYVDTRKINNNTFVVCIDMNNLKLINDLKGHSKGDESLQKLSNTLIEFLGKTSKVYRIGGDEFVILSKCDELALKNTLSNIQKHINSFDLSIAYGYELYTGELLFTKVYNMADAKMYDCKNSTKKSSK